MKDEFLQYFEAIGIRKPLQERINEIYEFYKRICPEEIEDVFVSEYVKEDGIREYQTIRFFSKNYTMLASDFVNSDTFNIAMAKKSLRVSALRVEKENYDFKKANDNSRMVITVFYFPQKTSTYKASKENCDYLKDIFEKRLLLILE